MLLEKRGNVINNSGQILGPHRRGPTMAFLRPYLKRQYCPISSTLGGGQMAKELAINKKRHVGGRKGDTRPAAN